EQAVSADADQWRTRASLHGCESELPVAEYVEASQIDFNALRHVHTQIAEEGERGNLDDFVGNDHSTQVEVDIAEQPEYPQLVRQPPAAHLPTMAEKGDDGRDGMCAAY